MALNKQVWLNTIVENFFPDNSFATKSIDDSVFVNNKTVHIPNAGAPSGVEINRTQKPASVNQRTDQDLTYDMDELTTNPIRTSTRWNSLTTSARAFFGMTAWSFRSKPTRTCFTVGLSQARL